MLRIALYSSYMLAFVLGVVVMLASDALGLPFVDFPFWRLVGVAVAGFAIWRLLIAVFGITGEPQHVSQPGAQASGRMIMKGPRIQTDSNSGSSNIVIRG